MAGMYNNAKQQRATSQREKKGPKKTTTICKCLTAEIASSTSDPARRDVEVLELEGLGSGGPEGRPPRRHRVKQSLSDSRNRFIVDGNESTGGRTT